MTTKKPSFLVRELWLGVPGHCAEIHYELKSGGDSLMLQRLLGHTILMTTNRYCQTVGYNSAVETHKHYSPVGRLL